MPRRRRWLKTDEYADVSTSLRKAADLVQHVASDITEWKWLLVTVHSATQGIFVLSLSAGNGLLTLKSSHAKAWLKAYETGAPWPQKLDLDYFVELYRKTKIHVFLRDTSPTKLVATAEHDKAIRRLNDLRNGFVHFGVQAWSIELAGLPTICLRCLEIGRYLGWQSGAVYWTSVRQSTRARRSLNSLCRTLERLEREYQR
jgi:hypothetical protein